MDKLPDDFLIKIIDYAFICKIEQNFYINKRLLRLSKEKIGNCQHMIVLKKDLCMNCNKDVLKFFSFSYLY